MHQLTNTNLTNKQHGEKDMTSNKINIQATNLQDKFDIRRFKSGAPSGWKTLKQCGLTVATAHGIDDVRRAKSSVNIYCTPELEECKNHQKRARNTFDERFPAWDGSYRLIPKSRMSEQWDWEDQVASENKELYRIAIDSVFDAKERDRIELHEGAEASVYNASLYPSEEEMLERYCFEFHAGQIPDPSRDVRVGASADQVERFRNELSAQQNNSAKEAHLTLIKRVEEQLLRVVDRMENYDGKKKGSFNDTLIPNLLQIANVLGEVNIYDDPAVTTIADQIAEKFNGISSSDLRGDEDMRLVAKDKASKIIGSLANLKTSKY